MRAHQRIWRGCALLALAGVAGCSGGSAKPPIGAFSAAGTASHEVALSGQTTLKCLSTKGMITVEGPGVPSTLGWYLYKVTTAPSMDRARAALDAIQVHNTTVGDTLMFDVVTPPTGLVSYYAAVTLSVPFAMNCVVEGAVAPVRVSYLWSAVTVRGSDSVSVQGHNGPFEVVVDKGAVSISAAVPPSGRCTARTGKGNIVVWLPASSSVALIARTERGVVTVTGLPLMGRVDGTGFVSGTLGAGTDTVRLETKDGDIALGALP